MAYKVVSEQGVCIRVACVAFRISESCYRYERKRDAENDEVANWLIKLTDMKNTVKSVLFTLGFAAFTSTFAECRRAHVCDSIGQNCRYQDFCSSTMDLPSIGLNPLPALPTMDLKPLPSMALPPLGTSKCDYVLVNGRWQNVCR